MPVNIEELMKMKSDILEQLKAIKNDIKNEDFPRLRAEYTKINNKLRYNTDEEHRKNKIEYIKKYRETMKTPLISV